jgi:hypothetical protein
MKFSEPDLYDNFLKSLYSKEIYASFELITPFLKKLVETDQP